MNELFKVNTDSERITISARDLHAELKVGTKFKDWFPRMREYGFVEKEDFNPLKIEHVQIEGGREVKRELRDYQITIDMAKEIAMLQRTEKGKEVRQKLIQLEKDWNSPEKVMARALVMANKEINSLTVTVQEQKDEIIYKENVIIGLVDDVDLATKRRRISDIIRKTDKKNYQDRYNLAYKEFEKKYHCNLKRRMENCDIKPKVKSKMDYIDRVMNKIPELYEIVCKLFENDVNKLMEEWKTTI